MDFTMSEQPRTIKIYNLLAGTNEFIGEGDAYIPPHTGLPAYSTDIAPPDVPAGFVAVFNSEINHGVSLKTTGVKRSMTWNQGTRCLFLNLGHYRKMSPGYHRMGNIRSGTAHPREKDEETEKLFQVREAEETKKSDAGSQRAHCATSGCCRFGDCNGGRSIVADCMEEV